MNMLGPAIGSSQIKFSVLDELFKNISIKNEHVVFHMDLSSVFCRCYNLSTWTYQSWQNTDTHHLTMQIVIRILNTIAHYRKYITFKLKKKNTFIITFDQGLSDYQKKVYPDLRKDRVTRFSLSHEVFGVFNRILHDAYILVQDVCKYFDDIFCIDLNTGLDPLTISGIILHDTRYEDSFHILFTRNLIGLQLCRKNVVLLYNKKEKSRLFTKETAVTEGIMFDDRKQLSIPVEEIQKYLSPKHIPLIIALSRVEKITHAIKGMNWPISITICLLVDMSKRGLITKDISVLSFMDALEQYTSESNRYKPRKERKRSIKMSKQLRREIETAAVSDINQQNQNDMNILDGFSISNKIYTEIINRYRAVSIPIGLAAVTKPQIMKVYRRMYNLYNQNYLEELNETLSIFGSNAEFIEITVLSQNIPYTGETENGGW